MARIVNIILIIHPESYCLSNLLRRNIYKHDIITAVTGVIFDCISSFVRYICCLYFQVVQGVSVCEVFIIALTFLTISGCRPVTR